MNHSSTSEGSVFRNFETLSVASWFPVVSWICHPNQLSILIDNQIQSCISTRERLNFVPHRSYFLQCLTGEAPLQLHLRIAARSEEHTSELQSPGHPVCRLLL